MLLRPARVARVTTKEELDAALASADRVVVEGDDALLSYAATKAAKDPALDHIDIKTGRTEIGSISVGPGSQDTPPAGTPPPSPAFAARSAGRPVAATLSPARSGHLRMLLSLVVVFGVLAVGGLWYLERAKHEQRATEQEAPLVLERPATPTARPPEQSGIPLPAPQPVPAAPAREKPRPTEPSLSLLSLAWPVVAIIAIVALFLIARQAIAGGRNVEIAWKVTEKVSGRLVITKVQTRTRASKALSS
ncbi:MAG TPA: hypothetical protein VHB27_10460 [Rhodopila sp.]|uniref:hypothetical protein n=1 Tax=Rhodopila sp. TaxID=2480087 RepID=UPI002CCEFAE0|nr:hypothetical protein [Rhodopila sp.]HVY15644.1 hypothetical protein [Rhodopila sp.]